VTTRSAVIMMALMWWTPTPTLTPTPTPTHTHTYRDNTVCRDNAGLDVVDTLTPTLTPTHTHTYRDNTVCCDDAGFDVVDRSPFLLIGPHPLFRGVLPLQGAVPAVRQA